MTPRLLLFALLGTLALLASVPAAATDEPVLQTASIDAALLPPDPDVVTDADLANVGAQPAVQQLNDDPNQLVVDDDLAQCPNADFTTAAGIQLAIDAAAPGAKIRVCPGNYSPINVHKADLWLQAPRTHGNANQCREGDPAQDAIIAGTQATGLVQIVASGVRFEGFIVHGNAPGPGIRTDVTGSGYELVFNEIRGNQYGIDFNANGVVETLVEHNCVRDNNGFEAGVVTSNGFSNVVFENNFFSGQLCVSITNQTPAAAAICTALPPRPASDVVVTHNSFVDDGSVELDGATGVVIDYNEFLRPFGGSVIMNGTTASEVSYNHIDGTGVLSQGIFVAGSDPSVSLEISIKGNKIEHLQGGISGTLQFFGTAVSVRGSGVSVLQNWIQFNRGSGIFLGVQSRNNTLRGNLIVGNGLAGPAFDVLPNRGASDGIRISAGATNNVIENNRLGEPLVGEDPEERANRDHDCHDNNSPGANVWRHNVGYTENQPGLCVRPA